MAEHHLNEIQQRQSEHLRSELRWMRARRGKLSLWFILASVVPIWAVIIYDMFPASHKGVIFGLGVGIAAMAAEIFFWWENRTFAPSCPSCGHALHKSEVLPQFGGRDNLGACPKCGIKF